MQVFKPCPFHTEPNHGDFFRPSPGHFVESGIGKEEVCIRVERKLFGCHSSELIGRGEQTGGQGETEVGL